MIQRCISPIEIRRFIREQYGIKAISSQEAIIREARALLVQDFMGMERKDKAGEMVASLALIMQKGIELGRGNDALGAARSVSYTHLRAHETLS
jgi:hypothetical protein